MAEISTFTDERGNTYNYKDAKARVSLSRYSIDGNVMPEGMELDEFQVFLWNGRLSITNTYIAEGDNIVYNDGEEDWQDPTYGNVTYFDVDRLMDYRINDAFDVMFPSQLMDSYDKVISSIERNDTSWNTYEEGDIFIWKGYMCIATAAIDQWDTIAEGVNVTKMKLSDIIENKINSAVYDALNSSY